MTHKLKVLGVCILAVAVILAGIMLVAHLVDGGGHIRSVATICYGFFVGYLAAWWPMTSLLIANTTHKCSVGEG